jgi:hypothetical protein
MFSLLVTFFVFVHLALYACSNEETVWNEKIFVLESESVTKSSSVLNQIQKNLSNPQHATWYLRQK